MVCEAELGTCEIISKILAKQPTFLLASRTRQHESVPTPWHSEETDRRLSGAASATCHT